MKFRYKITMCMVCILALLFAVGGTIVLSLSFSRSMDMERQTAQKNYLMMRSMLGVVGDLEAWNTPEEISKILSELLLQNDSAWSGIRLSSAESIIYESGVTLPSENLDYLHTDFVQLSGFEKNDRRYQRVSSAFLLGDKTLYLEALHEVTAIYDMREGQQEIFRIVLIGMVIVCAVITYAMAWLLTRPLGRLSRASKKIAEGNLSQRTGIYSDDDIGELSREFDRMAESMEKNTWELQDIVKRQQSFMGSFTHELKTPMASIIGYADLLRSQSLTEEEQAEAANYIFVDARRLEKLSVKLLSIFLTDNSSLSYSRVSPAILISRVASSIEPVLLKRNIKLKIKCEKGVCLLDPDLVWSLLTNLIDNAQKAMPKGGNIIISSKITREGCVISVSDDGRGIPEEALAHLTEEFYRVDKSRSRAMGGAGLGLALCKKIAELHHGQIIFKSKEGKGTTVCVQLNGGRP